MSRSPVATLLLLPALAGAALVQEPYEPEVLGSSGEGEAALQGFEHPDDLVVELFAEEPLLANPVAFDVGDDGVLYVCETFRLHAGVTDIRNHMDWLHEDLAAANVADRLAMMVNHEQASYDDYATEQDRVRRIVDEDGDGRADSATVFAGGFSEHAAGIGAGVLSFGGDVYYTCIPDLWRLRDADGDGVAEHQERLSSGYGVHVSLLGHDLHGLIVGPDGRLYFSSGDRGFVVETERGTLDHPHTGAVLRCNPDGSELEVFHTGLRNPQELAFDDLGNLFTGDNNSDGGDQARWVYVVEGGESGWRYSYQWIEEPNARGPWNDEKLWWPWFEGQAAYIVPPLANIAHGPSGLAYHPGTGLLPRYRGHFFLCDFRGDPAYSGVHTFALEPKGAAYELGPVERLIWNTLVTDVDFGPDGAVWFSDWVFGWNMTGKGRVYRMYAPDELASPLARETRGLLAAGFTGLAVDDLAELLGHADRRVRQGAHLELAGRGEPGLGALREAALRGSTRLEGLHGLWGLWAAGLRGASVGGTLREAWRLPAPELRGQALRVFGDLARSGRLGAKELGDDVVAELGRIVHTEAEPRPRFFAAIAAGDVGDPRLVAPAAELLAEVGTADPYLRHAGVMGLLGTADDAALEALATHASPHVRMGVLLVQRRRGEAGLARFLDDPDPALVLEAARAIDDLPLNEALPALAAVADERIAPNGGNALARRVLNARFRIGGGLTQAEAVARLALRDDLPETVRTEALELAAQWGTPPPLDRVMGAWRPLPERPDGFLPELPGLLLPGIDAAPAPVREAFAGLVAAAAGKVAPGAAPPSSLLEAVALCDGWLASDGAPASLRVRSLEVLAGLELEGYDAAPAMEAALEAADGSLRAAAFEALARKAPERALRLAPTVLLLGDYPERRSVYAVLARVDDPAATEMLRGELERLVADLVPDELRLDLVRAAEAKDAPELNALLERHRSGRSLDPDVAPYLDGLFGGDRGRGEKVFRRVDLSCVRCHTTWEGASVTVGPNLSGVAQRLTRLQILESIVVPNRRTARGYQGTVLFLVDGGTLAGRVLSEDDELVRLQDSDGVIHEVLLEEIDERRPDLSAMPQGLGEQISRPEMRDLLEYLSRL